MPATLFQKVWDLHTVRKLPNGQTQLFVGLHLDPRSDQSTGVRHAPGARVGCAHPDRTFATVDHIVPTRDQRRPFGDVMAEDMLAALEKNSREQRRADCSTCTAASQGIVHVIGPELGLTQPGMTIACGDSHTSTHGAFGAVAFGIGTSQVRDVLASQCLALAPLKVRRISVTGRLMPGVFAKDVILEIIGRLGVNGGVGFAYEYAGDAIERMSMDERMTICNMSIEGGARVGYVNPDQVTVDYLRGQKFAPQGEDFERLRAWWLSLASDADAVFDDEVRIDAAAIRPTRDVGDQSRPVGLRRRDVAAVVGRCSGTRARRSPKRSSSWDLAKAQPIKGTKIDVAFIGSCTNARLSDLREAARVVRGHRVATHVQALVVPGSQAVRAAAEREGLDRVFTDAGFEWRGAGCSMCLAMNQDKLEGRQICASSSNRNFKGRQGSPTGRTLLMSPAMVAAAAVAGEVVDVRDFAQYGD